MHSTLGKRYILGVRRGTGRLGDMFLAIDASTGREYTAVMVHNPSANMAALQAGFPLLASLQHANLARAYEVSEFGGKTIVIYERLEGETLADRTATLREQPIKSSLLPNYLYQAAQALAYAEKFKISHGSLDSSNIFLLPNGRIAISQIGLRGLLERTGEERPMYTRQDMAALSQVIDALWTTHGENDDFERTIFRMQMGDEETGYRNFAALVSDLEYMRANVRTTALPAASGRTGVLGGKTPGAVNTAQAGAAAALASLYFPDSGRVIEMEQTGEFIVGRKHHSQAIIPDIDLTDFNAYQWGISKLHARIVLHADRAEVCDMFSSNGTFVNGTRLAPETPAPVKHGDFILFGKLKVQFLQYKEEDTSPV
ncbi:MAG: FHA domain-containing protein [Anaerolineae bacterium]|nr:MAG: FHA domain-containing protein [Anaerolineae bacterium]